MNRRILIIDDDASVLDTPSDASGIDAGGRDWFHASARIQVRHCAIEQRFHEKPKGLGWHSLLGHEQRSGRPLAKRSFECET
jgi:hypothetical protein